MKSIIRNLLLFIYALPLSWISVYAQPPVVQFTSSRTIVCPAFGINFTDQSTNNPINWMWTFEGGTPAASNAQNPNGVFWTKPGTYDVTLVATNASGSNVLVQSNMIRIEECKLSSGIYRVPFADGTKVKISGDHLTHSPNPIRIDMSGIEGNGVYQIVAAADGWVRAAVDFHTGCCNQFGNCSDCNNYVWIEHPNGEWTKYTHFVTGTVTGANFANLAVDSFICAGTFLGIEGDVGASAGSGRAAIACDGSSALQNSIDSLNTIRINNNIDSIRCAVHLHFEVGIPDDPADPFSTLGGFLKGQNLIPVVCDVPGNIFIDGTTVTANPCDYGSCDDNLLLENQSYDINEIGVFQANNEITAQNNFDVTNQGNVLMSAGDRVVLKPGFRALTDSYFRARVGDCNKSPGAVCNVGLRVNVMESEISNIGNRVVEHGLVTYPNPVEDVLNIIYIIGETAPVNLRVVNMYGQEMMRLDENIIREAGTVHRMRINTGIMPPGPYFCILQAGGEVRVRKFVKTH